MAEIDKLRGAKLAALRKGRKLSQGRLSSIISLSTSAIQKHEKGENPSRNTLHKYASFYGVRIEDIDAALGPQPSSTGLLPPGQSFLALDAEGLYGRTEEREVDGVRSHVTLFEPETTTQKGSIVSAAKPVPDQNSLAAVELLVKVMRSADPAIKSAIMTNLYAFISAAEKDKIIASQKEAIARLMEQDEKLSRILDIIARYMKPQEQENRGMMREFLRVVNGNDLLNRPKR